MSNDHGEVSEKKWREFVDIVFACCESDPSRIESIAYALGNVVYRQYEALIDTASCISVKRRVVKVLDYWKATLRKEEEINFANIFNQRLNEDNGTKRTLVNLMSSIEKWSQDLPYDIREIVFEKETTSAGVITDVIRDICKYKGLPVIEKNQVQFRLEEYIDSKVELSKPLDYNGCKLSIGDHEMCVNIARKDVIRKIKSVGNNYVFCIDTNTVEKQFLEKNNKGVDFEIYDMQIKKVEK